jgi:formylglycine-generating enzyme required for sulfatase activity
MARIFISHSSANTCQAIQLRDWLATNGWGDVFLDLDPERGIAAGERWKEALQKAAQRCEVVIALISPEWLASAWCRPELNTAQLMGKKIVVLLIGSKPSEIPGDLKDTQYVDLINDPDAYARLKLGLKRLGLDPSSFPFAEGRRPYPGFPPFEEEDAAIFFGRDAQIVRGLDKLRRLTRTGVERMLIILGASGCGKSSFLRAGLWPRLKRDDSAWLPLPTIRPERAAISGTFGLVEALYRSLNETHFAANLRKQHLPGSRAEIEEFITNSDDGLVKILVALRESRHMPGLSGELSPPPTIVLPVDQGEELFNEEGHAQAERFIDILSKSLVADSRVLAILTMRTDSFPQVQNNDVLAALPKDTFTLDKMLEGSYREIVEAPAALVKPTALKIDPQLTEALLQDAAGQDALALLAFTLRHLYDKYQANNELKLEGYDKLGRLKGVIETTVKQALAEGVSKGDLPKDEKAQLALIRTAFIPHLARINPAGEFVRRIATRAEIPPEARPVIERLVEARLLINDRRTVGGEEVDVIEVAHEALLRKWKNLNDALVEEREFLVAKGQLEQDLADYKKTPERHKEGALLGGNKLMRARDWLISRYQDLTPEERQFIKASADAERAVARTWQWLQAAVGVFMLGTIVSLLGIIFKDQISDFWFEKTELRRYIATNFKGRGLEPQVERSMKPGDTFRECAKDCPEMVVIPPGEFWMGSRDGEGDQAASENPRHRVKIEKSFAVAKFELTWDDWLACVAMRGCDGRPTGDSSYGRGRKPLINVSWEQAKAYAAWLSRMTGKPYRLLTEAEWEYAARGVSRPEAAHPRYPWGDDASHEYANYGTGQCCAGRVEGRDQWYNTAPVGQFLPNAFGLYDMQGNVAEWVEDIWHDNYRGDPPIDGSAWETGGDESSRVVRGGSWYDPPEEIKPASRDGRPVDFRSNRLGFRVGRTLYIP